MTITLPIPHKALFPNGGHGNFHTVARERRRARQSAFFAALQALGVRNPPSRILAKDRKKFGIHHLKPLTPEDYQRISRLMVPCPPPLFSSYTLTFRFPTNRNRDDDNFAASCKSYRDGIADALRANDSTLRLAEPPALLHDKTIKTPFLEFKLNATVVTPPGKTPN